MASYPRMRAYAARDSRVLLPLYEGLTRLIEEPGGMGWVVDLEERLLKVHVRMADNGVLIDKKQWTDYVGVI